jgi:N6-adenosine-specific RNA methylase IME4
MTAKRAKSLQIDPEFRNLMPPLTKEEYESLEKSICREGCRDPLVVWENIVLDGIHRLEICRKHGIPFAIIEKECENRDEAKLWIIENQYARRNLTDYWRCLLALAKESLLRNQARERQREGGRSKVRQNSDEAIDVKKKLAKEAGVSHDTIAKVKVIEEKASDKEKTQLKTPGSHLTINRVYRRIRRDEVKTETPPFPRGKYGLIYADPPWQFEFIEDERRSVQNHYATMTLEELMLLPISSIAQDDCVLMMWAPACKVDEAMRLMKAWGFTYRTCAVWVKNKIGMGHYFRTQHEMLLLAIRGNPPTPLPGNRSSSVINAPRPQQHSEKPIKVYEILEKMYPRFGKIELFARKRRDGWVAWGNQLPSV